MCNTGKNNLKKNIKVNNVDSIRTLDWGVFNIIYEEIAGYEYQDKTVEEIAQAICSRLEVYVNENYG